MAVTNNIIAIVLLQLIAFPLCTTEAFSLTMSKYDTPSKTLSKNDPFLSKKAILSSPKNEMMKRRCFSKAVIVSILGAAIPVSPANAAPDCLKDCLKSCKEIAPKDPAYCLDSCKSYCEQTDREDGLSGSVGSSKGETGILGTSTVVKGEDRPPSVKIPGLNFNSDKGRKLLGY